MLSNVNSRVESGSASSPAAGEAKLASLRKREHALKEQLGEIAKTDATPAQAVKSGAITQQIGYVESQIEQLLLAAQLAKLGDANPATSAQPAAAAAGAAGADAAAAGTTSHGLLAPNAAAASSYRPGKTAGKYVDIRA